MMQELKRSWGRVRALLRNGRAEVIPPEEAYDRWAASYRSRMNPLQELEEEALRRLLPDLAGRKTLDVGCGTGRVAGIAVERGAASVTGVDTSAEMLEKARARHPSMMFARGSLCALPFGASSFDVITCALVLGHVEPLHEALSEMNRVLRPGGHVVISDFHPFATLRGWDRTFQDPADGRTYAIAQYAHLFEEYVRCFRANGWTMGALEEPRYQGFPAVFVLRARKEDAG